MLEDLEKRGNIRNEAIGGIVKNKIGLIKKRIPVKRSGAREVVCPVCGYIIKYNTGSKTWHLSVHKILCHQEK